MFDHADDALARVVRFPTERRFSLKALGIAGLATALLAPRTIEAKQSASKKARKRCRRQVGQCRAAFETICERSTFVSRHSLPAASTSQRVMSRPT
jgi:hypothetical protein